jgi:serine/threonine protein kinase
VLASFNHPGLVQVYDAGEVDGRPYVVLELVAGATLADRLQTGALPPPAVAELGMAVADALASVHERGVVHRDVTPANVLCGDDGRVRLADFGITRLVDEGRWTDTSVALGTPAYMAPEQVRGLDATPAADVYALGLVLLEALTGRRAYEGTGVETALARLVRSPDARTRVPSAWRSLLGSMTALEPADRPSVVDVRDRLERLQAAAATSTAALPVAPLPGADAAHASTIALTTRSDSPTAVLPARAFPVAGRARPGKWFWAVLVAALLVVVIGVGRWGIDAEVHPPATTTTSTVSVVEPVVNGPATSPSTTVATGAGEPKGEAKGHDKQRKGGH